MFDCSFFIQQESSLSVISKDELSSAAIPRAAVDFTKRGANLKPISSFYPGLDATLEVLLRIYVLNRAYSISFLNI